MLNYLNVQSWKEAPDRDDVLARIYDFIRTLAEKGIIEFHQVYVKDPVSLRNGLDEALKQYLSLSIEDEEWEQYENKDLSYEIDDPADIDEDLILPEFSGKGFVLKKGEAISVKLLMRTYVTPIRLNFELVEFDELYFLKVTRITAE